MESFDHFVSSFGTSFDGQWMPSEDSQRLVVAASDRLPRKLGGVFLDNQPWRRDDDFVEVDEEVGRVWTLNSGREPIALDPKPGRTRNIHPVPFVIPFTIQIDRWFENTEGRRSRVDIAPFWLVNQLDEEIAVCEARILESALEITREDLRLSYGPHSAKCKGFKRMRMQPRFRITGASTHITIELVSTIAYVVTQAHAEAWWSLSDT